MLATDTTTALFETWMDRVGISPSDPAWRSKCGKMLGKSDRMIGYYREGHPIPRDTLLLMDAIVCGYKPREWGSK